MKTRMHTRAAGALAGLALAAGALAMPAYASHPAGEGGTTSKPVVNMEQVLRAAQLDPHRGGGKGTKYAKPDVARVQRRLLKKHLLPNKGYVDGVYGSYTKSAYAKYQRRLGYSGIGANGLPGPTSLKKLLGSVYRLTRPVSAGKHVLYDGHTVNARTRNMMLAASHRLGKKCLIGITQGSYNAGGVNASAGTHDGGGAVDVDLSQRCARRSARSFARCGSSGSPPGTPVHRGCVGRAHPRDRDLGSGPLVRAADQVWDFYIHRDGLKSHAKDTGPQVGFNTWEASARALARWCAGVSAAPGGPPPRRG